MAGAQRTRVGLLKGLETLASRGVQEMQDLGREAEAAAHRAYKDAIRANADLALRTQGDVRRFGAKLLAVARGAAETVTLPVAAKTASKIASPAQPDAFQDLVNAVGAGLSSTRSIDRTGFVQRPISELIGPAKPSSVVKIGTQYFEGRDNGRANVLVPIEDPTVPEIVRAEQRRAVQRALFIADHPLAGVGYTFATLAGAQQDRRDAAMLAGGLADVALLGAAGLGAEFQRPLAPKVGIGPIPNARPNIRYRTSTSKGQAGGMSATLTSDMLGTGTKADRRLQPPGWRGNGKIFNQARSHLLAKSLGGTGAYNKDVPNKNIVALTQHPTNSPEMRAFESDIARRVKQGEIIEYFVTPLYDEGSLAPAAMLLTAFGARGEPVARVIQNPESPPQ
jgi:hypothetical protein